MRILHIGSTAGVPQTLAREQRRLGHQSDILSFYQPPYELAVDYGFPIRAPHPIDYLKRLLAFLKVAEPYDVYHFHVETVLPKGLDTILWRLKKKCIIVHHHGTELRSFGEKVLYKRYADAILVSTPDLLEWSEEAVWLPNPISVEEYPCVGIPETEVSDDIHVVHAPTNRAVKGTEHIVRAVQALQAEGYPVTLDLIEDLPHTQAVERYKQADIAVDWINPQFGIYGVFSIECMALGKPVVCTLREDLVDSFYDRIPILNSDPSNLSTHLQTLIDDRLLRRDLGAKGRSYVTKVHDSKRIVQRLLDLYVSR
jgi:glycosyltransferase involved in cell wall biosynthesis